MIGDIRKFRFWCQKVLPLVYDDSLSYYEVLCKVVNYLNHVIDDVNSIPEYIDGVIEEKLTDEHLQELIEQFVLNIESAISSNNESNNANSSADYDIGQMLWWNGKLYRVIRQIDAGDTFIVDTNIELINFEDLFNDFVDEVKHDITANDDGGSPTATQSWTAGTWLWLNDVLYIVKNNITEGNAYVFSGDNANVEQITVEGEIKKESIARTEAIGEEATLRENADNAIIASIGNLDDLHTIDKSNIVDAINELADADISFDTVNDIEGVNVGDVVITKGFYEVGDGGGCIYVVTEDDNNDLPTIYANNMYLMVANEPINILSLGCKLNDTTFDNSTILNAVFNKWSAAYFAPYGNLYIANTVIIPEPFKGSIRFNANIHADGLAGTAVQILSWNCNTLYFSGMYGDQTANSIGLMVGGTPLTDYVINDTIIVNRIVGFTIGLKLEASNHFGVLNNKFYLTRIDDCDYGIYFEVIGTVKADGFITQNQFYNVWITGDGLNVKTGIWFQDNMTSGVHDIYNENNFLNLTCEGCGTIVGGDAIRTTKFDNIRLGEQGPVALPTLFNLGSHCAYNNFSSNAFFVLYTNITDLGEYDVYNFNFRDPVTNHELGNCATFRNGKFMLKGECLTQKAYTVRGESTRTIDPYRSVSFIDVDRVATAPVDIILPNNARESNYAPTLFIKLTSIGGGVRIKDVDGNVLASTDGSGGTPLVEKKTYVYYVNYNHAVLIMELADNG